MCRKIKEKKNKEKIETHSQIFLPIIPFHFIQGRFVVFITAWTRKIELIFIDPRNINECLKDYKFLYHSIDIQGKVRAKGGK